ncbi:MAG TPA: hypothetical protein VGN12_27395 [Pirellulales bacterium]|jgi:hypothetical protein
MATVTSKKTKKAKDTDQFRSQYEAAVTLARLSRGWLKVDFEPTGSYGLEHSNDGQGHLYGVLVDICNEKAEMALGNGEIVLDDRGTNSLAQQLAHECREVANQWNKLARMYEKHGNQA